MKNDKFTLLLMLLFCLQTNAQISTREVPGSFIYEFQNNDNTDRQVPEITIPDVDIVKLQAEDEAEAKLRTGIGIGASGHCQVSINCSEGNNWQNEKRAVAKIIISYDTIWRVCTGALINNTNNDFAPYFLTAAHCLYCRDCFTEKQGNPLFARDCHICEIFSNLSRWKFQWNYELAYNPNDCNYKNSTPTWTYSPFTTVGAQRLVAYYPLDFLLLKLTQDPIDFFYKTEYFVPYYLGWDRIGNRDIGGVVIHHPSGDAKKIATFNELETHVMFRTIETPNGHSIVEGGTSGSPMINNNRHVIAIVTDEGTGENCDEPQHMAAWYSKFANAWTTGGLGTWLDPTNTGVETLAGISAPCPVSHIDIPPVADIDETFISCADIYAENVTIHVGVTLILIAAENIYVQNVTVPHGATLVLRTAGNINVQNVTVASGGSLNFNAGGNVHFQNIHLANGAALIGNADGEVLIDGDSNIELGAELNVW